MLIVDSRLLSRVVPAAEPCLKDIHSVLVAGQEVLVADAAYLKALLWFKLPNKLLALVMITTRAIVVAVVVQFARAADNTTAKVRIHFDFLVRKGQAVRLLLISSRPVTTLAKCQLLFLCRARIQGLSSLAAVAFTGRFWFESQVD